MPITINIRKPLLDGRKQEGRQKVGKRVGKKVGEVGKRVGRGSARGSGCFARPFALNAALGHYHPGHSSNSQQRTLPLWRPGARLLEATSLEEVLRTA